MPGEGVVTIEFARSGGFVAAPGLQVRGTVTIAPGSAAVEAIGSYRRELGDGERRHLADAVSAAVERGLPSTAPSEDRSRDAYRLRLTIRAGDRIIAVSATSGSTTGLPPPVQTIVDWVDRESAAIVRSRSARNA